MSIIGNVNSKRFVPVEYVANSIESARKKKGKMFPEIKLVSSIKEGSEKPTLFSKICGIELAV